MFKCINILDDNRFTWVNAYLFKTITMYIQATGLVHAITCFTGEQRKLVENTAIHAQTCFTVELNYVTKD